MQHLAVQCPQQLMRWTSGWRLVAAVKHGPNLRTYLSQEADPCHPQQHATKASKMND